MAKKKKLKKGKLVATQREIHVAKTWSTGASSMLLQIDRIVEKHFNQMAGAMMCSANQSATAIEGLNRVGAVLGEYLEKIRLVSETLDMAVLKVKALAKRRKR